MIGRADVRRQSGVQSVRISFRGLYGIAVVLLLCLNAEAQNAGTTKRPRAADIGVKVGILPSGPVNAITDVAGVEVGQTTIIRGNNVRTGVTAILPHGGNLYQERVPGGVFVGNGYGKLTGSTQVDEMGEIETPILLTSTTSVPRVADALISYMLSLSGNENVLSINPMVGETNDGYLNDIRGRHIAPEDVTNAIRDAKTGPVDEGTFGAGTGTVAFGWKGGIGTASRRLPATLGGYTVGVLVQSNFGYTATLAGLMLLPGGLAMACLMPVSGQITNYVQPKFVIAAGLLVLSLALWHMTSLAPEASFQYFAWSRVYQTAALPFLFIPITAASYVGIPSQKTEQAASLINVARNTGGSMGISLYTTLLAQHEQLHQSRLVESIYPSSIEYQNTLNKLTEYFLQRGSSHQDAQQQAFAYIGQQMSRQAILLSYVDMFALLGTLAIVLMVIILILLRTGAGEAQHGTT